MLSKDKRMAENIVKIDRVVKEQVERIAEKCASIKPVVVISCITYNHELYIREALDGFVMQQTNFPFVAIVHDDASTDDTAAIIREYAEKYPDIIKPIYETENQYSKHDGSLWRIMQEARNATGAKYVAMCEGDDYWTAPLKLQKQVDILESHPDYSMCFHNAIEHWEESEVPDKLFSNLESREYTGAEIYAQWIVPTASVIVKRKVLESDIYIKAKQNREFIFGDIVLFLSAAHVGKTYAMKDIMSVYRRHEGGVTHYSTIDLELKIIEHQKAIVRIFGQEYKRSAKKHISHAYMAIQHKQRMQGNKLKAVLNLLKSISYCFEPIIDRLKRIGKKIAQLR